MKTGRALYDQTSTELAQRITENYSTSFSLGIKAFSPKYRAPIYAIYGFVRLADEIVDTFFEPDQKALLEEFKTETFTAIARKISLNPVLHAFQDVVNTYDINHNHIYAFLKSMSMDLEKVSHDHSSYDEYIFGSAEAVGLMCLKVWCSSKDEFDLLEEYGKALGAAFQKVNFLRDMGDDFDTRGRVYFPKVDFNNFSLADKKIIEADIQKDFDKALIGIKLLPKGVRLGVYLSYKYFYKLFLKIKKSNAQSLQQKRIRVNDVRKLVLFATSSVRIQLNML